MHLKELSTTRNVMSQSSYFQSAKWALITGATSGIGLAYAKELAKQNKPVDLVARSETPLKEVSGELNNQYGALTRYIVADLSTREGANKVISECQSVHIDLLINNAGKEELGQFSENNIDEMLSLIALNCSAPLILSHHFSKKMFNNGGGNILFLSSIVAFQGVPLIANYVATKAYDLIFAEGISSELKQHGIAVSIVGPGFTESNLSPQINFKGTPLKLLQGEFLARYSLTKMNEKRLIIPGFINKFLFYSGKYFQPRRMNSFAFGLVFKLVLKSKFAALKTKQAES
jgi:short-subunit dehydrogenase